MNSITIEPMRAGDAEEVSRLIASSVRNGFSGFYTPQVIEAVVRGNSTEAVCTHAPGQTDYVACSSGRILGMIGLKHNEIGHLFIRPEESTKGLGRLLVDFARKEFKKAGYAEMFVLASLNSVGFYKHCGFAEETRGSFSVGDGLHLDYVRMTCTTGE